MAVGRPLDPVNENIELEAIDEVLRTFQDGSKTIVEKITAQIAKSQAQLDASALKSKEALYRRIADLYAKGMLKSDEEAAKFAAAELQKRQAEKLRSEIEILQTISKEGEAERRRQESILEKEKEILELRAAGNEEEARQKEKELAQQKKKDKREQEQQEAAKEDDGYEFGDGFYDLFADLRKEMASENSAAKIAEQNMINTLKGVGQAITAGLNAINDAISSYAKYQAGINGRLQGVSSFSSAVKTLSSVAFSPLLSAEDLYSNLADLVGQGIVTNVEQRAMFETVKEGIAGTFDVTSDSLKRLIRVQQNDSTAARLGMEAYLTEFLNVYVQNTEYLQSTFDTVSSSLLEASATMTLRDRLDNKSSAAANAAELEFVVQKWLGSLAGVGLSDAAASAIAESIGQLGSGNVEALGNGQMQNLVVMAANKAGLNYGEMLNEGLDASDANELIKGMVVYLQEVAATGTNVVKSQLADIFGVTISDLAAVMNITEQDMNLIHKDLLTYNNMYGELTSQFKQLPGRLGISNILENLFANLTYQTGMGIASNPITYALWKITDMIQGVTNGIAVPMISVMGNAFDLNTTVENLMKLGIVGISTLGNIGKLASGLGSIGDGSVLLKKLKVAEGTAVIKSFGGSTLQNGQRQSGSTTSEATYVGNNDGETYNDSALNEAEDDAQKKLDKKKQEEVDPITEYFKTLELADRLDGFKDQFDLMIAALGSISASTAKASSSSSNNANNAASANAANALLQDLMQSGVVGNTAPTPTAPTVPDVDVNDTPVLPDIDQNVTINIPPTPTVPTVPDVDTTDTSALPSTDQNVAANTSQTTMQSAASDVSMSGLATIANIIVSQINSGHTAIVDSVAPVATTNAQINVSALALLSEIAALNGTVVSTISELNASIIAELQKQAAAIDSSYSTYTDNMSEQLQNTYENVAGDVANNIQNTTTQLNEQILGEAAAVADSKITFSPTILVEAPTVVLTPDIHVAPQISLSPKVEVATPTINFSPEVTAIVEEVAVDVHVTNPVPAASVEPEVTGDIVIPSIVVYPQILNEVLIPPAVVTNNITTEAPIVNVEIPPIVNNIEVTPPAVYVNPEVVADVRVPPIEVAPQIVYSVPNITIEPEVTTTPPIIENITVTPIVDTTSSENTTDKITSEFDKYMSEQGVVNNNISSNVSQSSDVSDYLIEIDFATGFKGLVETVYRIKSILEDNLDGSFDSDSQEEITGFSNFTFDK